MTQAGKRRYILEIASLLNKDTRTKTTRKRASRQLNTLNQMFESMMFPSTQLRAELGRRLVRAPYKFGFKTVRQKRKVHYKKFFIYI
jgi:hypothetical protein